MRACCSASGSRASAAPVRTHSHRQGAAMHFTKSANDLAGQTFSSPFVLLFATALFLLVLNGLSQTHPNVCLSPGCKYTVHSQCANKNPEPCARTFVKSKKEIGVSTRTLVHSLHCCSCIRFADVRITCPASITFAPTQDVNLYKSQIYGFILCNDSVIS